MKTERIIPATWRLDDSVRPVRVVAEDLIICEVPPHAGGLDVEIGRRIAAAQDLLDALQKIPQRYLDDMDAHTPGVAHLIRIAIAKATKEPA